MKIVNGFDYRKGVITASISHNVLTKVRNPARSSGDTLVARVLGYNRQVKTAAMSWGIEKEKYARKRYVNCCGVGNLEIKCPFSHRDKNIQQYVNQRNSCLAQSTDTVDVDYILKQNHHYYTQVQHQMYVTGALYTDFVVYLPKESAVVRVKRDDCFANISIPQLKQFFYDFIVPEMFTKTIYNKRVCQDTLDSIINKVVQVADQEKVQHELNQLTILSLPPPVTTSTVSGLKRKSSVAGPQLKKK